MSWSYGVEVADREALRNASDAERDKVLGALAEAASTGGEGAEEHRAARTAEITEQARAATDAAAVLVDALPGPRWRVTLSGHRSGVAGDQESIAVTVSSYPASFDG